MWSVLVTLWARTRLTLLLQRGSFTTRCTLFPFYPGCRLVPIECTDQSQFPGTCTRCRMPTQGTETITNSVTSSSNIQPTTESREGGDTNILVIVIVPVVVIAATALLIFGVMIIIKKPWKRPEANSDGSARGDSHQGPGQPVSAPSNEVQLRHVPNDTHPVAIPHETQCVQATSQLEDSGRFSRSYSQNMVCSVSKLCWC